MVDYLNHPTLAEYITKNKETMSYQTMIYLAYIIAQALRYLQEYQIAHLDLKPANIMVCKQVMVKLIDFGESYHPEVKGTPSLTQVTSPASQSPTRLPKTTCILSTIIIRMTSFHWE
jgi:serine/threonine protein kinase